MDFAYFVPISSGEQPPNQLNKWRILRDNADMDALTHSLESLCDQFLLIIRTLN